MSKDNKEALADQLAQTLADSYTLYLQTHNFHWNVTGPMFNSLHTLFETQYTELATAVDEIAERIRTLGYPAPGTYQAFAGRTRIEEVDGVRSAEEMLERLIAGQQVVVESSRAALETAGDISDQASEDLMVRRIDVHEKNAWMLRSSLPSSAVS